MQCLQTRACLVKSSDARMRVGRNVQCCFGHYLYYVTLRVATTVVTVVVIVVVVV